MTHHCECREYARLDVEKLTNSKIGVEMICSRWTTKTCSYTLTWAQVERYDGGRESNHAGHDYDLILSAVWWCGEATDDA